MSPGLDAGPSDSAASAPRSGAHIQEPYHLQIAPGNGVVPCERYPVDLAITLRWGGVDRRRTAVDVSEEGMFVESPDHVPVGELIQVVAALPGGFVLRGLCAIERVVTPEEAAFCGGMPGMGLSFLLMDSTLQSRWERYLSDLQAGTLPEPSDPDRSEHVKAAPLVRLTRRTNERRKGRFRVRMKSRESLVSFHTNNVSRGGMFISTDRPLDPGRVVSLFVVHPVSGREFALQAQVRWCRTPGGPNDPGMGVQIIDSPEDDFALFVNEG